VTQVQLLTGSSDRALAGHRTEIEQMVVIEPAHVRKDTLVFSMVQLQIFDLFFV
jgi:hypothetical protein